MKWTFKKHTANQSSSPEKRSKYSKEYFEGLDAFKVGKELYNASSQDRSLSVDRRRQKQIAALEFFDQAIERGYEWADIYLSRGSCLNSLGYELDALEDYNKAIEKDSEKAHPYFIRALIKESIYDYEGSIADIKDAIRLSKHKTEDNKYWNDYSRKTGYGSATEKYEIDLEWVRQSFDRYTERIIENRDYWEKEYADRKGKNKRRGG
jgi:tetratricopeptide (TPR) repeat protein